MSFLYITKYNSPNFSWFAWNDPTKIVFHHWGPDGQRFASVVSWLCNRRAKASAHFVAEAGKVACLVNCNKRAWHAGPGNLNTIGIECRPEMSTGDIETIAELIAVLWHWYPKLKGRKFLYHSFFMPTACPGRYKAQLEHIRQRAEYYYPLVDPNKPGISSTPHSKWKPIRLPQRASKRERSIDKLAKAVIAGKYGNGDERRRRLGSDYTRVQARVNELLRSKTRHKVNYEAMANAVLRGEYGNGAERKHKLGPHYDAVQKIVNKKLGL